MFLPFELLSVPVLSVAKHGALLSFKGVQLIFLSLVLLEDLVVAELLYQFHSVQILFVFLGSQTSSLSCCLDCELLLIFDFFDYLVFLLFLLITGVKSLFDDPTFVLLMLFDFLQRLQIFVN